MRNLSHWVTFCLLVLLVAPVWGEDWSQWQGEQRNGRWDADGIVRAFPAEGPPVVWRAAAAMGYAGPAVVGDQVFLSDFVKEEGTIANNPGRRDEVRGRERIRCLDATTGETRWSHEDDVAYSISYGGGPRATPTVYEGMVYVLGAMGNLRCVTAADGKLVWSRDLLKEYNVGEAPIWGYASHPLVVGDTVYCLAGGEGSAVVALDRMTGKEKWRALSAANPGYCPPTLIEAGGRKQLIVWTPQTLNSLDPETGNVFWSKPLAPAYEMSIIAPVQTGDYLLATALQGSSMLLKLDASEPAAEVVWEGKGVHPDHNPPLVDDGYLYGIDVRGQLRCIELVSGERVWESLATCPDGRPVNSVTGFLVKNKDAWFIMTEMGELIVAQLTPDGYQELGRAKLLEPTNTTSGRNVVWSHPAFANHCVYARNDKEIICVDLSK